MPPQPLPRPSTGATEGIHGGSQGSSQPARWRHWRVSAGRYLKHAGGPIGSGPINHLPRQERTIVSFDGMLGPALAQAPHLITRPPGRHAALASAPGQHATGRGTAACRASAHTPRGRQGRCSRECRRGCGRNGCDETPGVGPAPATLIHPVTSLDASRSPSLQLARLSSVVLDAPHSWCWMHPTPGVGCTPLLVLDARMLSSVRTSSLLFHECVPACPCPGGSTYMLRKLSLPPCAPRGWPDTPASTHIRHRCKHTCSTTLQATCSTPLP